MKESFNSIAKVEEVEVDIKRSKFIAVASPVDGEAAAISFIEQIKEKHKRATHNVFAYLINEQLMRYSDDGEPAGTAGMPVLYVLKKHNF